MSLSDDIKAALVADTALMTLLTGGIFNDVEEINRTNTPGAFDSSKEIKPCALIKYNTELPLRSGYKRAVNDPFTIYFYQRQGYDVIEQAMDLAFDDLNEQKIGTNVWSIEFDIAVK